MKLLLCLLARHRPGKVVAQKYPAKPVRLVLSFAAGSAVDVRARIHGQKMSETWGQQAP